MKLQPTLRRLALPAVALFLATHALGQGGPQVPSTPDPSTYGEWSDPAETRVSEFHIINAFSGSARSYTGKKTIRTRTGIFCKKVTPAYCGGQGQVAAGVSFTFFGAGFTTKAAWDAPAPDDKCDLCAIYLCGNATQTERSESGTTTYFPPIGAPSTRPYSVGPLVTTVPDGTGLALKQSCNTSDEAHEFCCPDTAVAVSDPTNEEFGKVEFGQIETMPSQYGLGSAMPDPVEVDLLDIAAIVQIDLRNNSIYTSDVWSEGLFPVSAGYRPETANEMSITQRYELAMQIVSDLDLLNSVTSTPPGRVLLSVIELSGNQRTIDMGTVIESTLYDTFRLKQPADVNLDGYVDQADMEIVLADKDYPSRWCRGDVNMDGLVNSNDLQIVESAMHR